MYCSSTESYVLRRNLRLFSVEKAGQSSQQTIHRTHLMQTLKIMHTLAANLKPRNGLTMLNCIVQVHLQGQREWPEASSPNTPFERSKRTGGIYGAGPTGGTRSGGRAGAAQGTLVRAVLALALVGQQVERLHVLLQLCCVALHARRLSLMLQPPMAGCTTRNQPHSEQACTQ